MHLTTQQAISACLLVVALGSFIWGCWQSHLRHKADDELKAIIRRGDAPYFSPSDAVFTSIAVYNESGGIMGWFAKNGNVLNRFRKEVVNDFPIGWPVVFPVDNIGEPARSIMMKLDGEEIPLKREAHKDDSNGLLFLEYAYKPEKHGKEQIITISFETRNGVQDTHRYITRHGFRILKRIDPPLPQ